VAARASIAWGMERMGKHWSPYADPKFILKASPGIPNAVS
jgi:hypothetical protein